MPTTLTERTRSEAPSLPGWVRWVAAAIAVGLVTIAVTSVVRGPRFVAQVSFVNPSPYALDVQIAGADKDGWLALGTMGPKQTSPVEQVIDQGNNWVFRITAQGLNGGDFTISRADLVRAGWRVSIPPEVIARLEEQGIFVAPPGN